MMTAINTVLITLMPLHYSQAGRIPTTIGFLNTAAYLGSGIAGYGFGNTVESSGWGMIRFLWCGTALSAIIICFIVRKKWGYFCRVA
jgi:OPA family glycerol-3-phosphate transporter-like MFS transporter